MGNVKKNPWNIFDVSNSGISIAVWFVISLLIVISFLAILSVDRELYMELAKEGTNTERLTSIFYLAAGILFLVRAVKDYRQTKSVKMLMFPLLFGLFFLFIAGEEESWGQWLFYYDTPEAIKNMNTQKELNVHNLSILSSFISPHGVLNLLALMTGIIIPLVYLMVSPLRRLLNRLRFPVSPLACMTLFILGLFYEKASGYIYYNWASAEIREFLFSIAFLLFSISAYRVRNRRE